MLQMKLLQQPTIPSTWVQQSRVSPGALQQMQHTQGLLIPAQAHSQHPADEGKGPEPELKYSSWAVGGEGGAGAQVGLLGAQQVY